MTSKPGLLAAAAAAVTISAPAAAAITLTGMPGGALSGSFTQAATGVFVDTYTFTPASVSGLVSVVLTSVSGPVSFFTGSLNDQNFSFFDPPGSTFSFKANVTSAVPLTLTVFGAVLDASMNPTGSGVYGGTVTVAAPVPEPATWALLMAGLGVVGWVSRGRRAGPSGSA